MPDHGKRPGGVLLDPRRTRTSTLRAPKCAVTFVHTVADQATFKSKNFVAPRKCPCCVQSTKAAKIVLYKAQLVANKLAKKKKKQTLRSAKALASG